MTQNVMCWIERKVKIDETFLLQGLDFNEWFYTQLWLNVQQNLESSLNFHQCAAEQESKFMFPFISSEKLMRCNIIPLKMYHETTWLLEGFSFFSREISRTLKTRRV